MKLFYSPTSPYARKCRILILEKGLADRVELVEASPYEDPAELRAANPLGKVPALARPDGPTLINSPLICAYLDSLSEPRWIPAAGEAHWAARRFEALADGIIDLTIGRRIETMRDVDLRYHYWTERWERGIEAAIAQLEAESESFQDAEHLGALAVAVALGYLDFRYAALDWRAAAPKLAGFAKAWFARESFHATAPPAGA